MSPSGGSPGTRWESHNDSHNDNDNAGVFRVCSVRGAASGSEVCQPGGQTLLRRLLRGGEDGMANDDDDDNDDDYNNDDDKVFAKRCAACSKPITGQGGTRFISFEGRHWHSDCFVCALCKQSMAGKVSWILFRESFIFIVLLMAFRASSLTGTILFAQSVPRISC